MAAPWPVDVLTPEYLISGEVGEEAQKWGWAYFNLYEKRPAGALTITVTAARSTGALAAPALVGSQASFALSTALVALIPRGDAAIEVWEEWNGASKGLQPVAAGVLVGDYALSGWVLSPDGTLGGALINDRLALRSVAIQRGDDRIDAERAIVWTQFVHAAVLRA